MATPGCKDNWKMWSLGVQPCVQLKRGLPITKEEEGMCTDEESAFSTTITPQVRIEARGERGIKKKHSEKISVNDQVGTLP